MLEYRLPTQDEIKFILINILKLNLDKYEWGVILREEYCIVSLFEKSWESRIYFYDDDYLDSSTDFEFSWEQKLEVQKYLLSKGYNHLLRNNKWRERK